MINLIERETSFDGIHRGRIQQEKVSSTSRTAFSTNSHLAKSLTILPNNRTNSIYHDLGSMEYETTLDRRNSQHDPNNIQGENAMLMQYETTLDRSHEVKSKAKSMDNLKDNLIKNLGKLFMFVFVALFNPIFYHSIITSIM